MPHIISPYDREEDGFLSRPGGIAGVLILSLVLHALVAWLFVYVFPNMSSSRAHKIDDVITVQLLGSLAPPAPSAPKAPVNPDLKGPDVVEVPKRATEATPQPPVLPVEVSATPADVIPLKPKEPEKPPEVKKTQAPPPPVTPPKVEQPKPKAKPKDNLDSDIEKKLRELQRKVEADELDESIEQKMANLASRLERGTGEGSERGGASQGQRIDPEKARYYQHIQDIVSSNWVPPPGAISANLEAEYMIVIEPSGRVSSSTLRKSSGNQDYDLSVARAVSKSSPFPPLPPVFNNQADRPALRFNLGQMRQRM